MKNLFQFLTVLCLLALSFFFYLKLDSCTNKKADRKHSPSMARDEATFDSVMYWFDKNNAEHATVRAVAQQQGELSPNVQRLRDSIADLLQVNRRHVKVIASLETLLQDTATAAVSNTRTDTGTWASWSIAPDRWLKISGVGFVQGDSMKSMQVGYIMRDSLTGVVTRRPGGLLRREAFHLDVASANPAVHITGMKAIVIKPRPKRFGIGLQAGVTVRFDSSSSQRIPLKPDWYLGAGISYNVIRF